MELNNAFSSEKNQYTRPEANVICLDNQDMICRLSPLGTEMNEGDDNW